MRRSARKGRRRVIGLGSHVGRESKRVSPKKSCLGYRQTSCFKEYYEEDNIGFHYEVGELSRAPPLVHILGTPVEDVIFVLVPHRSHHFDRIYTMEEVMWSLRSKVRHLTDRILILEEDCDIDEMILQHSNDQSEDAPSQVQALQV
ncbi:unnamed protein product [Lactuca saligna]|uniref:Uncharacterized protein n=1 Tax=Lactuca saligna TaxID=75948 RepID=A0AA35Z4I2_LACSI|nr:unnamed protein product [Lactuca saligna]